RQRSSPPPASKTARPTAAGPPGEETGASSKATGPGLRLSPSPGHRPRHTILLEPGPDVDWVPGPGRNPGRLRTGAASSGSTRWHRLRWRGPSPCRPELPADHDPAPGQLGAVDGQVPERHPALAPTDLQRHADRPVIVAGTQHTEGRETIPPEDRAG